MDNVHPITIIMADDNPDDRLLTEATLKRCRFINDLRFVENGQELLDYLQHREKYQRHGDAPSPGLILLDLNMPVKDGRQALKEIKADSALRQIPIIVLTASDAEADVERSYNLGIEYFITKPVTMEAIMDTVVEIDRFKIAILESNLLGSAK